jgi:hypothetical protein
LTLVVRIDIFETKMKSYKKKGGLKIEWEKGSGGNG